METTQLTKELVSKKDFYQKIVEESLAFYKTSVGDCELDKIDQQLKEVCSKFSKIERNKPKLKLSANYRKELKDLKVLEGTLLGTRDDIERINKQLEVFNNLTDEQKQVFVEYMDCLEKFKGLSKENSSILNRQTLARNINSKSYGIGDEEGVFYGEFVSQALKELESTNDGKMIASFTTQFAEIYAQNCEEFKKYQ